jgi:Ca2+-binding RTX toxin-like protein
MPTFTGTPGPDTIHGTTGTDLIQGLGGNDTLYSHGGGDRLEGGLGDDIFVVFQPSDLAVENVGEGRDIVYTYGDYRLENGMEIERLSSVDWRFTTPLQLVGNEFVNLIEGNAGDNYLDGAAGADTLVGFAGDDVYIVDNAGDQVIEAGDTLSPIGLRRGGLDTVYTFVDYALARGSFVEILSAYDPNGTAALRLTGNELDNLIEGNAGANVLYGGGGSDVMYGFGGNDTYVVTDTLSQVVENAGAGSDTIYTYVDYVLADNLSVEILSTYSWRGTEAIDLTGNNLDNIIEGNDGANIIDGGSGGTDILYGFAGNDVYQVRAANQTVVEAAGGGSDRVNAYLDYVLPAGSEVEWITLLGTGVNATGNEFGQRIDGTAAVNVLNGGGGNDELHGAAGADILNGGDGNDTLYGEGDSDELHGGAGADVLVGDDGNNLLDGGSGADTMTGGTQADTYMVDNAGDVVTDVTSNSGNPRDVVITTVDYQLATGNLIEDLRSGGSGLRLTGNEGFNQITGDAGDNFLNGRFGRDTLTGGGGADTFAFDTAIEVNHADTITDFQVGVDKIGLDDGIFIHFPQGALSPSAFVVNTNGASSGSASDQIIYNSTNGQLLMDVGGAIGPQLFFTLAPGLNLQASDFIVY